MTMNREEINEREIVNVERESYRSEESGKDRVGEERVD